jgi:hypothetical protein
MSYSISTLLSRNLHDVFGENDAERRVLARPEVKLSACIYPQLKKSGAKSTRLVIVPK